MAKVGIEVEGRYRGMRALFLSAGVDNFTDAAEFLREDYGVGIGLVYISDPEGLVDYMVIGEIFDQWVVTIDTHVVHMGDRPDNVNLMLRVDHCKQHLMFDYVDRMYVCDQIKIERDRMVYVLPWVNVIYTNPDEFEGDKEVTL